MNAPRYATTSPAKSKTGMYIIIAVVVLLLIGGGYYYYTMDDEEDEEEEEDVVVEATVVTPSIPTTNNVVIPGDGDNVFLDAFDASGVDSQASGDDFSEEIEGCIIEDADNYNSLADVQAAPSVPTRGAWRQMPIITTPSTMCQTTPSVFTRGAWMRRPLITRPSTMWKDPVPMSPWDRTGANSWAGTTPPQYTPRINNSKDNYYNFCNSGVAAGSCSEAAFENACRDECTTATVPEDEVPVGQDKNQFLGGVRPIQNLPLV